MPSAFLFSMVAFNADCVNIESYPDLIVIIAIGSSIILFSSLTVALPFNYFLFTAIKEWNNSRELAWKVKRVIFTIIFGLITTPFLVLCICFYFISLIGPLILKCIAVFEFS